MGIAWWKMAGGSVATALLVVLASCKNQAGTFGAQSFRHEKHPYAVAYKGRGPESFLGHEWRLDNYQWRGGWPGDLKLGDRYSITRVYDFDDDGRADKQQAEPFFDLLFTHTRKDANIWLQNVPLAARDAQKELSVIAERYVEAASGSGQVIALFGSVVIATPTRRYASKVLDGGVCRVGGQPAYRLDFELANVDQLQLSPTARWTRARIVLVQVPYMHQVSRRDAGIPVVMLTGLESAPDDFEKLSRDFEGFLDRVAISNSEENLQQARYQPSTCRVAAAAAAPALSAVPAAPAALPAAAPAPVPTVPAPAPAAAEPTSDAGVAPEVGY